MNSGHPNDIYFSEEIADMKRNRVSGEKGMGSNEKAESRKNRSTKASSEKSECIMASASKNAIKVTNVCKPPQEKRIQTEVQSDDDFSKRVSANDEFYGFTDNSKPKEDKTIELTEGPKAKHYIPKNNQPHKDLTFEIETKPDELISEVRYMYRCVSTSDFAERGIDAEDLKPTDRVEALKNSIVFHPEEKGQASKIVKEIRLELETDILDPETSSISGWVYYNLKDTAIVEKVTLEVHQQIIVQNETGNIIVNDKPLDEIITHVPACEPDTTEPPIKAITTGTKQAKQYLEAGTSEIGFQLMLPEKTIPSFIFFNPQKGTTAFSIFSISATTVIGGVTCHTNSVSFIAPGVSKGSKLVRKSFDIFDVLISDPVNCCDPTDKGQFEIAIIPSQVEKEQGSTGEATVRIKKKISIPALELYRERYLTDLEQLTEGNEVLSNYNAQPDTEKLGSEHVLQKRNIKLNPNQPSVKSSNAFFCEYLAEIKFGEKTRDVPFVVVSSIKQPLSF